MDKDKLIKTLKRASKLEKGKEIALAQEFNSIEENILNIDNKVSELSNSVDSKLDNLSEELKKKLEQELVLDFSEEELASNISKTVEDNLTPKIDLVTRETKKELLGIISDKQSEALLEVRQLYNQKDKKIEQKLNEVGDAIIEIQSIEVKDGYTPVKGVDYFDGSPDTGEDIVSKINKLPVNNDDLKIDAKHIKNLPNTKQFIGGGSNGVTEIVAGTNITVDNSNPKYPVVSASGGGGSGTVTSVDISVPTGLTISGNPITTSGTLALGLDTGYVIPLQSTLDGFVPYTGATSNLNLGLNSLISHSIIGDASDGIILEASNGTDIGILGAGNTANVTWYGNHNFNTVTASRVAQFGASKTLESSNVTNTELGYLSGVTSAIQTQLDGRANTALSNLASVAINTDLLLGTSDGGALGSTTKMWSDLFLASGGVINFNNGDIALTHSSNLVTMTGGNFLVVGKSSVRSPDLSKTAELQIDNNQNISIGTTNFGVAVTSGSFSVAIGRAALGATTSGSQNFAFGENALAAVNSGSNNVAIGVNSGTSLTTGSLNTFIGSSTGQITTGQYNTIIGSLAGSTLTSGGQNIIIGHDNEPPSATASGQIVIGNLLFGTTATGTGTTISTGSIGVGTNSPDRRFHEEVVDAVTNAVTYSQRHSHITSGTATTGFGIGEEYELENASGTNRVVGTQEFTYSDATNATEDATYKLRLIKAGTLTDAVTVDSLGHTTLAGVVKTAGYTVATLPAGVVGYRAYVTDALAPAWGANVVGGGAVTIPVFYDGANWIVA